VPPSALRPVLDSWLFTVESDASSVDGEIDDDAVETLLEQRLADVAARAPVFPLAVRAYRRFVAAEDNDAADGLVAWLGGQPHVAAHVKRQAGIKGDLDHFLALGFLRGLLAILRDSGHAGLLLVLDEIETLQRVRSDARAKALNALRQFMDEVHDGNFPGLYLLITGTPAFFDGTQGIQRAPALAQRLAEDFGDPRFDNPRAPQIRLTGFDLEKLQLLGQAVRDLYAAGSADRVMTVVDDAYIADLAKAVTGGLGGKAGIAPRLFLRKLVGGVLDRVDQFTDFDPRRDYRLTLNSVEMSDVERNAASADDVELEL
jgi:hypothetical protein